jgi:hypothetical protein
MKFSRPFVFFQGISETWFSMLKRESPDMKTVALINNPRFSKFLDNNFIIDIHIKYPAACLNILGNPWRPDNVEGIVPVHL